MGTLRTSEGDVKQAAQAIATTQDAVELCSRCGGLNGAHGLVHVRLENGGGINRPCPATGPGEGAPQLDEVRRLVAASPTDTGLIARQVSAWQDVQS